MNKITTLNNISSVLSLIVVVILLNRDYGIIKKNIKKTIK